MRNINPTRERARRGVAVFGFVWAFPLLFLAIFNASAQEFRVDNRVFNETDDEPEFETTTYFHGSLIYDCIGDAGEITIYDLTRERIVLLDPRRQTRSEASFEEIRAFLGEFRRHMDQQENSFLRFMTNPLFQTTYDEETSVLESHSPYVTYRVVTEPGDAETVAAYRNFSDWASMTSMRTNPGASPPFARMKVNEELAERGFLPKEIYLTLRPNGNSILSPRIMRRSEHDFRIGLTDSELREIANIGRRASGYETIPLGEYVDARNQE